MRILFIAAVTAACAIATLAQDIDATVSTRVADDARFEMVQVPWDKGTTFRLDKYKGIIHRLSTCARDDSVGSNKCWKEMIVVDVPREAGVAPARFQIVMNNLLRTIFLVHVVTGQTWQYALDNTQKWHPFLECADKNDANCLWRPLP